MKLKNLRFLPEKAGNALYVSLHRGELEKIRSIECWPSQGFVETVIPKVMTRVRPLVSYEIGCYLFEQARALRGEGEIVEIGSFQGFTTICLALGSRIGKGGQVTAVDADTLHAKERLLANLEAAGVSEAVETVFARSEDAVKKWDKPIELLYVDGGHRYLEAKHDLREWGKHLVSGGLLIVHDFGEHEKGVMRACKEEVIDSGLYTDIKRFKGVPDKVSQALVATKK